MTTNINTRFFSRTLVPVFLLLLLMSVLFPVTVIHADETWITINSPRDNASVGSSVTVSASYMADFSLGQYPKPTEKMPWKVSFTAYGTDVNGKTVVLSGETSITSISGGASCTFNLGNNTGTWQFTAELMQPAIPFGSAWAPIDSDSVVVNYGTTSGGFDPGGEVPAGNDPADSDSGGGAVVGIAVVAGGAVAAGVIAGSARKRNKAKKSNTPVKSSPADSSDLYQEWWNKAGAAERQNWDSFEKFLISRLGPAHLKGFIDQYGRISWASAYTSWQAEVKKGLTGASFADWAKAQAAGEQQSKEMSEWARRQNKYRNKDIDEAAAKYSEALRNKERFQKLTQIRNAISGDATLVDFVNDASRSLVDANGNVDADKLARLENTLQRWIIRDKMGPEMPDYTMQDAYFDTVSQASKSIIIRGGMAYLTGGYSEMVLNPVSSVSTMRQSIMDGKSTLRAVTDGYAQSSFELALGESGRLVKYAKPYINSVRESYNLSKLSGLNSNLASEVSTINQLAKQSNMANYSRNAFMKNSEVVKLGKTATNELDDIERMALELNNNPEFKELMTKNPELLPSNVKEIMGVAKQKAYEEARNKAIGDVMNQMSREGIPTGENPFFLQQTGTHARAGNPGWNPLKSDFDHTVDFGSSRFNKLYEQKFNTHLESQGTSAAALDANVYGAGTSSRGAYSGGAMKFVQNYNQTTGSDVMVRVKDGMVTISREEPQVIDSLLSKMKAEDIVSAKDNYTQFFKKSLEKGGTLDNMIQNTSKEVSRKAGQYSVDYVQHFQNTGKVNYQVPDAAKVADLIKKRGFSVDGAIQKVGYNGSKTQLMQDFKKIMGQ